MAVTVGIDIGTTSVKAVAADDDGAVVARSRVPHDLIAPQPDQMHHDIDQAWRDGVLRAWAEVSAGHEVLGVTVAAMVPSLAAVDSKGRGLTPGLLYGDARGAGVGGMPSESGEYAGFLRWTAGQAPGAAGYWPAQAVANHALCGHGTIDTMTAFTAMPVFDGQGWSAEVLAEIGVDPATMPGLSPGTDPIGEMAATRSGGRRALVSGGTIDAMGESMVAGAGELGDVLVICGTTLIVNIVTEGWPTVEGLWTMPNGNAGQATVSGASNAGGLFLQRVRAMTGDPNIDSIEAVAPGRVPVWVPYIRGERTPLHDPNRRAALVDVDVTHDAAAVMQAGYEAAAFVVRHHIELAAAPARRIVATGGGTHVAPWVQALADGTGLPVDIVAVPEGAALGAAFLARVTAGLEADARGARRWARVSRTVEPCPEWVEACAPRYDRFVALTRSPA